MQMHNLPEIFSDYFLSNKDIHNYNTRDTALLHKKFNRTNNNKHTLANKEIRSFPTFKATLKKYFLHRDIDK